jgi:hypothetical protein
VSHNSQFDAVARQKQKQQQQQKQSPTLRSTLSTKLTALTRTPFGTLFRLFLARMFHGSSDGDDGQLDLGPGVIAVLLAMPGLCVSLLMFEKYGSLMHFLNGDLIANFRKIPFTCPYPQFESTSGLILVAYLFGFFVFTDYLPQLEHWALLDPLRALLFIPSLAAGFAAIHIRRRQLLDMDKSLVFNES